MAEKSLTPSLDALISSGAGKSTSGSLTPSLDQYLSNIAPIKDVSDPRELLSVDPGGKIVKRGEEATSAPVASSDDNYLGSVRQSSESALNMMRSGSQDILQGKSATGVGKLGLGMIGYPISPITGGIHEFVGKPAAKIGGVDFGEKAELLAGGVLPIGATTKAVANRLPTNAAVNAITKNISTQTLIEGLDRLKSNPRLSAMDVFPSVRQIGQKLIVTEGKHQNEFEKFIDKRIGSRREAIEETFSDTVGAPPNVLLKLNELKKNIKDAGKEIDPVINTTGPVDISGVVSGIDAKLKPGITSIISAGQQLPLSNIQGALADIRKYISDDKSFRTDANSLHNFQSSLRATADNLINSQSGKDRSLGYAMMDVRNQLVNAIDAAGLKPGEYKRALGKYRDENNVQDAFDKGATLVKNREGVWTDRPEFWKEWIRTASKQELEAAREGAKTAFDHSINATRFQGRKGMEITETPFNREKLEMLFGKKEVNEMARRLADERGISETNTKMIGGSQTAMRLKAEGAVQNPSEMKFKSIQEMALPMAIAEAASVGGLGNVPGAASLTLGGLGLGKRLIVDKGLRQLERTKNNRLTDLLTSTGPEREELIKILEDTLPKAKLSLGQKMRLIGNP